MTDSLSKSLKATEQELSWANRGLRGDSAEDGEIAETKLICQDHSRLFFYSERTL